MHGADHKSLTVDALPDLRARIQDSGERLVLTHGIFDVLHPGHVSHLQQARDLGDRLLVSITADDYVRRGPGRPVFPDHIRMETLAALGCVDHVVLSRSDSAVPIIDAAQPDIYCKGREYVDSPTGVTDNFDREKGAVEKYGGEVRLLGGVVYSSTQLANHYFDVLPLAARGFAADFGARHTPASIGELVDQLEALSVLVVGEVIIDEYIECEVQGVTGKERIPSVRWREAGRHWGGAFAVARHLAELCGEVTLAGIAGDSDPLAAGAGSAPPSPRVRCEFLTDSGAQTVVKQRYVSENKLRAELGKVFAVNHIAEPAAIAPETRRRFRDSLKSLMGEHDLVVVTDYGHGLFDQQTMDLVQDHAPFLALNCQTNSANYGFNLITKYRRADTFSLDQRELSLAYGVQDPRENESLLRSLHERLDASTAWLTLGADGAIGIADDGEMERTPALTLHVRDTLGAGDAFFAVASASACAGHPLAIGSFLGALAGALATNITGNERPVEKVDILKFAETVLKV